MAWSIVNEARSSPVEIRRLWPSDMEAFRDHLLSLGPRSRHLRFGGGMSDDFLVRYAENCFGKGDLIYNCIAGFLSDGRGVRPKARDLGAPRVRPGTSSI